MTGLATRLFLLQHGAERVPRSLSLRGGSDLLGWEPLVGVLVETGEGWVLFDTGALAPQPRNHHAHLEGTPDLAPRRGRL